MASVKNFTICEHDTELYFFPKNLAQKTPTFDQTLENKILDRFLYRPKSL